MLVKAYWPYQRQAKYIRLYIKSTATIYELKFGTFLAQSEIDPGTLAGHSLDELVYQQLGLLPSPSTSSSPSMSPSASLSPSASPSISPSASPSDSPSAGVSESPSASPSASPSEEPITYTTWNSSDKDSGITLSGGNLVATKNNDYSTSAIRSVLGKSSGKWYWELTMTSMADEYGDVGVGQSDAYLDSYVGGNTHGWGYRCWDGRKFNSTIDSAYGNSFTTGDIVGIALDMDNGKVWFSKNGTWQNSGDPVAGTGYAFSGVSGTIYAMISFYTSTKSITANFGASAFTYSAPSGFTSGLSAT